VVRRGKYSITIMHKPLIDVRKLARFGYIIPTLNCDLVSY